MLKDHDRSPAQCIQLQHYKVICLNDNFRIKDFDSVRQQLCRAFDKILPEKSTFEI